MTSDELFEPMAPAPHDPPPAAQINHAELGQAWRSEVHRDAAGRPLLALATFAGGHVLPLLFGRGSGRDGRYDDRGWGWRLISVPAGTGNWRDGGGWEVLSPPAGMSAPDRRGRPDHETVLESHAREEILGEAEPLDSIAVRP